MFENEIIELLSKRVINGKTNNYIFTGYNDNNLIDQISDISLVRFNNCEFDLDIEYTINVKINFEELSVYNIFSYILNYFKQYDLVDEDINLGFNSKFDIMKFEQILKKYNLELQIICTNLEALSQDECRLFNELMYYYSPFYSVISFVKENLKTYFLSNDRVLDNRENYTKVEIKKINDVKTRKIEI